MDITLRKRKDAAQLVISGAENTRFFWDTFRLYAQNESTLRLCSPAFQKKLFPLLGRQVNYPDGKPISMKMGLGDIPTFCSCVLPQIEGLATVEDPGGLMNKYSPEECTPCFYLDLDGDGCLTLELRFRYGEREVHSSAASEEWGQIRRDPAAERAKTLLSRNFRFDGTNYYLDGGEEAAFAFLTESLSSLRQCGEVYDPWWNLAAQEQATDRAHRIGQQERVQVYKLIAKDTIEEQILDLQDKKAALMDALSGTTEAGILEMSKEELLELLKIG